MRGGVRGEKLVLARLVEEMVGGQNEGGYQKAE